MLAKASHRSHFTQSTISIFSWEGKPKRHNMYCTTANCTFCQQCRYPNMIFLNLSTMNESIGKIFATSLFTFITQYILDKSGLQSLSIQVLAVLKLVPAQHTVLFHIICHFVQEIFTSLVDNLRLLLMTGTKKYTLQGYL